ncbi:hypothetical protein BN1708_019000 [Verticillium longisporum]|uniref:Uncharacterized protein n=1 Tax=Verticillium longisporum TaxID=100787 RepID=A0A0G4MDR1_VERLO|nr:hypothetical protein BN1708_019000 [Verticillium longisporum]
MLSAPSSPKPAASLMSIRPAGIRTHASMRTCSVRVASRQTASCRRLLRAMPRTGRAARFITSPCTSRRSPTAPSRRSRPMFLVASQVARRQKLSNMSSTSLSLVASV